MKWFILASLILSATVSGYSTWTTRTTLTCVAAQLDPAVIAESQRIMAECQALPGDGQCF